MRTSQVFLRLLALSFVATFVSAVPAGRGRQGFRQSGLSKEDEILPDFMIRPFGEVYFSWEIRKDVVGNDMLVGTWNFTSNVWVGIGIKSDKRMHGPLIVCGINQTSMQGECNNYISHEDDGGTNRRIERLQGAADTYPTDAQFAIFSEGVPVNGELKDVTSIGFTKMIWYVGDEKSTAQIDMNAAYRVIFAMGTFEDDGTPKQHHTDNTDTALINFVTGKVENLSSGFWKIALGVNCGITAFFVIVFKIVRVVGVKMSNTIRNVLAVIFCILFAGMVLGFIYARYIDYLVQVEPKAFPRAFGDGAAFCMAVLMMPVSKRILFPDLLGVAYARAIKYHIYVALVFMACAGFHGAGMFYYYDFDYIARWRDKDKVSRLPGLLTYIVAALMIPIALLRFKIGYRVFRWSHYLYILLAFLAVCHFPMLAIYCTPGLSLLVLSFLHKRLATPVDETETIKSLSYDKDANAITLQFVKDDAADPGRWYFLSIPDISRHETHPFSVCKLDADRKQRYIKFVIRPTANPKGFTQALQKMAEDGKLPTRYKLDGPHMSHQVQCRVYEHIFLICAGMGITGHNHFLDQCVDDNDEVWMDLKKTISLLWVVREADLFKLFSADLNTFVNELAKRFPEVKVTVKIFVTNGPGTGSAAATAAIQKLGHQFGPLKQGGRPDLDVEIKAMTDSISSLVNEPVATYVSGPPGFQDAVGKALSGSSLTHHVDYECYRI